MQILNQSPVAQCTVKGQKKRKSCQLREDDDIRRSAVAQLKLLATVAN
jgi:hypothetical protein